MNSILSSPQKRNLHMQPVRNGQSGSAKAKMQQVANAKLPGMSQGSNTSMKGAIIANHNVVTIPSPFVWTVCRGPVLQTLF